MPSVITYKENKVATTAVTSLLSTATSNSLYAPPGPTSSMTTQSGTAITGGAIFNGLALGDKDAVLNEGNTMDECLSHTSPTGQLHYHSISPCAKTGSTTVKPALCNSSSSCLDFTSFMYGGWKDTTNYGGVYGLARDGHVIYGPYNKKGELWGCEDHDACNGFFLADGSYGYASSTTFPYIVGCWGPATIETYAASCSTNSCGLLSQNARAGIEALSAFAIATGYLYLF
jgi:YHYH protein